MRGLEGNMMAQPRVFGHDAAAVVSGAVNSRIPAIDAVIITDAGSSYDSSDVGDTLTQASTTGSGSGIEVNITEVSSTGTVTGVDIITSGSGYQGGEVITLTAASSGGTGAKLAVRAQGLTLPDQTIGDRGAVIYNGGSAQNVTLYTESYNVVQFKNVQPGTVVGDKVPILAKAVTVGTDLIAVY
jgi:hypothetical protein